jgi:hypothetical protein
MDKDTNQTRNSRRIYVLAVWGSAAAAVVISIVYWRLVLTLEGQQARAVLLLLLFASAGAGLAGVIGLYGLRSSRRLIIIPVALLGICINAWIALVCLLGIALEGKKMFG